MAVGFLQAAPCELHFSLLPGDSNQDGVGWVSTNQFSIPEIFPPPGDGTNSAILGDINGDGLRDGTDSNLINAILNVPGTAQDVLPLSKYGGDYVDNDRVEVPDYQKWSATFGSTTDLAADGSMSGDIDGGDYNIWRNEIGLHSAWNPTGAAVTAGPYVDFGNAPRVLNLTISGSNSYHTPYSFDSHDGSGEQLRSVPIGRADTISITFSEDVNVTAGMLRVVEMYTASVPTLAEFTYDLNTMTASWRFEQPASNLPALFGMYMIALDDSVTDVEGNRLDGEWVNPANRYSSHNDISEFPSGDGAAGGDFNFLMVIMPGDADGDNYVGTADYVIWQALWGADGSFEDGDFWGDGIVGTEDEDLLIYFADYFAFGAFDGFLLEPWMVAELNGDYEVNQSDLDLLVNNLGMTGAEWSNGDLNDDGVVDVNDLDLAFAMYGLCFAHIGGA